MISERIALITGAFGDIGQAIVRSFLNKGVFVVATDKDLRMAEWMKEYPNQVKGLEWDFLDHDSIDKKVEEALEWKGKIDILVNNAGVMSYTPLEETSLEEWDRTYFINVTIPFLLTQKLLPSMKNQGFGRIINVSSAGGKNPSSISGSAYAVSKASLNFLTRRAAHEWGPYGITVNGVAPGPIRTQMSATFSQEKMDQLLSLSRIKRMGNPEEVAELIAFLSSEAAGYITGEIIDINGGSFID